jgi:hypothetical protein
MANLPFSGQPEELSIATGDLFAMSKTIGGGDYVSRHVTWATIIAELGGVVDSTKIISDNTQVECVDLDVIGGFGNRIKDEIPTPFNFLMDGTGGKDGNQINDGGSDMYDSGNRLNTNLDVHPNISYSDGVIISGVGLFGGSSTYFTRKYDSSWVLAVAGLGITNFFISGGLGADGSGTQENGSFQRTVNSQLYTCFYKRVRGTSDPSINHIIIVPGNGAGITQMVPSPDDTDDDYHEIDTLGAITELYFILAASTSGGLITTPELEAIADAFLDEVSGTPGSVNLTTTLANLDTNNSGIGDRVEISPGGSLLSHWEGEGLVIGDLSVKSEARLKLADNGMASEWLLDLLQDDHNTGAIRFANTNEAIEYQLTIDTNGNLGVTVGAATASSSTLARMTANGNVVIGKLGPITDVAPLHVRETNVDGCIRASAGFIQGYQLVMEEENNPTRTWGLKCTQGGDFTLDYDVDGAGTGPHNMITIRDDDESFTFGGNGPQGCKFWFSEDTTTLASLMGLEVFDNNIETLAFQNNVAKFVNSKKRWSFNHEDLGDLVFRKDYEGTPVPFFTFMHDSEHIAARAPASAPTDGDIDVSHIVAYLDEGSNLLKFRCRESGGTYFTAEAVAATPSPDRIFEGDSSVEVIDAGTGQVDVTIDATAIARFTGGQLSLGNTTAAAGRLHVFDNATGLGNVAVLEQDDENVVALSLRNTAGGGDWRLSVLDDDTFRLGIAAGERLWANTGGFIGITTPSSAPTDGDISASQSVAYLDETAGDEAILWRSRKSGGAYETFRLDKVRNESFWIDASAMQPDGTVGAVPDTEELTGPTINQLLFVVGQEAHFKFPLPPDWDLGTIRVRFYWDGDAGAAATETVAWALAATAAGNDDPRDVTFAESAVEDALIALGDFHISDTLTVTVGGTPAADDIIQFRLARRLSAGTDLASPAKLQGIAIQYTATVASPAAW